MLIAHISKIRSSTDRVTASGQVDADVGVLLVFVVALLHREINCCFQTLIRIWDCFLLEGPKVLFRFALAILKLNEQSILEKTDTISIMRHLKSCAALTFDIEGVIKVREQGREGRRPSF